MDNAATTSDFCIIDFAQRDAYNAAFAELGLRWRWGNETLAQLQSIGSESDRVRRYLDLHQAHLLTAYDADFLVNAILEAKARYLVSMADNAGNAARSDSGATHVHHAQETGF